MSTPVRLTQLWMRLPLLRRVMVSASAVLFVAGNVMLILSVSLDAEFSREQMRDAHAIELDALTFALAEPAVIGDFATIELILRERLKRADIHRVAWVNPKGITIEAIGKDVTLHAPAPFVALAHIPALQDGRALTVGGRTYGQITVEMTATPVYNRLWKTFLSHLAVLILASFLDFAGIWWILRSGLRPLKRLEQATDDLAAKRLDTRLAVEGSPEMRHLIVSFNRMAEEHEQDIAERERTTTELMRAKQAAEAASLAKSQFLSTMSHELRTPMTGILGMAELLRMPETTEKERNEFAEIILSSGQTLMSLLNDVLDSASIEAGKLTLSNVACDPWQIARDVTVLFTESARSKGLNIEVVRRDVKGGQYRGDPIRLRQMLSNLVSNAIKFTSSGFVRLEIAEISRMNRSSQNEATLEFSVTDSGIGISQDKQSLLFEQFSQVDGSFTRQYGGTGLGLSIVRRLSKLMNGDAGVESEVDKGSRFWFRIRAEPL